MNYNKFKSDENNEKDKNYKNLKLNVIPHHVRFA